MRLLLPILISSVALLGIAHADPRRDMAAALAARADLHPTPAVLPVAAAPGSRTAATPTTTPRDAGRRAADQSAQAHGNGQAIGLARRAQDAAMSAAGQAQEKAAKDRAGKPHPH